MDVKIIVAGTDLTLLDQLESRLTGCGYRVGLSRRALGPSLVQISVSAYLHPGFKYLPVLDSQGHDLGESAIFGRLKIKGEKVDEVPNPVHFEVDAKMALIGYHVGEETKAGESLTVSLYWQALREMNEAYTISVLLTDDEGHLWAQGDGQPRGAYYPTDPWEPGEVVGDQHTIPLPPNIPAGHYHVSVGVYLLETMERLPAFDGEAAPLPEEKIPLGEVEISCPRTGKSLPLCQ